VLDASSQLPFNSEDWLADETSYDTLKKWVNHAYRVTNKELIRFMFEKYQFYNH
jgi:hypothetical protein